MIWFQGNLIMVCIHLPQDQSELKGQHSHGFLEQPPWVISGPSSRTCTWVIFHGCITSRFSCNYMSYIDLIDFLFFKQVCFSQPPQPALQLDCCEVRDWTSLSGNYLRCVGNQCGSLWVNVVQSRFPWLRSHFRAESLEPLIISRQFRNVLIYPALIKWSSFY